MCISLQLPLSCSPERGDSETEVGLWFTYHHIDAIIVKHYNLGQDEEARS